VKTWSNRFVLAVGLCLVLARVGWCASGLPIDSWVVSFLAFLTGPYVKVGGTVIIFALIGAALHFRGEGTELLQKMLQVGLAVTAVLTLPAYLFGGVAGALLP
jgi:hypothetical protein